MCVSTCSYTNDRINKLQFEGYQPQPLPGFCQEATCLLSGFTGCFHFFKDLEMILAPAWLWKCINISKKTNSDWWWLDGLMVWWWLMISLAGVFSGMRAELGHRILVNLHRSPRSSPIRPSSTARMLMARWGPRRRPQNFAGTNLEVSAPWNRSTRCSNVPLLRHFLKLKEFRHVSTCQISLGLKSKE